jgi:hypothetical protein
LHSLHWRKDAALQAALALVLPHDLRLHDRDVHFDHLAQIVRV